MKTITCTSQNGRTGLSLALPEKGEASRNCTFWEGYLPSQGPERAGHMTFALQKGAGITALFGSAVTAPEGGRAEVVASADLQGNGNAVSLVVTSPTGGVVQVFDRKGRGSEYVFLGPNGEKRLEPAAVSVLLGEEFAPPAVAPPPPSGKFAAALAAAGLV